MSKYIAIKPNTKPTKNGNLLVEHPAAINASAWKRITVAVLCSGQGRPYADSVTSVEIAFEGGCCSNQPDYDLPHHSHPTEEFVRELVRVLYSFKDNPGMGDSYLRELAVVEQGDVYTIWRATVVTPYMD